MVLSIYKLNRGVGCTEVVDRAPTELFRVTPDLCARFARSGL